MTENQGAHSARGRVCPAKGRSHIEAGITVKEVVGLDGISGSGIQKMTNLDPETR